MNEIKLVTWDWNGTVLADTKALIDAANHIIKRCRGSHVSRTQYIRNFHFPTIEFYATLGCDRQMLSDPKTTELFHEFYERKAVYCRTRRGAREVLAWLKRNSIDSIILSNHMKEAIEDQIKRLKLECCFKEILANTDYSATQSGNNKIRRLEDYFKAYNINPSSSLIVGDSPEDINIGKKLGMITVAIEDGYFHTPRLREAQPVHIIKNLSRLIQIIKGYSK